MRGLARATRHYRRDLVCVYEYGWVVGEWVSEGIKLQ